MPYRAAKKIETCAVGYGAGLRVTEVVALKVTYVDSQRMLLGVQRGKGGRLGLLLGRILNVPLIAPPPGHGGRSANEYVGDSQSKKHRIRWRRAGPVRPPRLRTDFVIANPGVLR